MNTIKTKNAKNLKKGDTFQDEQGYGHIFEEYCNWGILTIGGELIEYSNVMQITFAIDAEMLEAIKAFYGEDTTDAMIKEEINLIFKEKKQEVYNFITENLTEMI